MADTSTRPTACHCGWPADYARCCGAVHAGHPAADAEALMRSRYSAYAVGDVDYLLASWHPSTRPGALVIDPPGVRRWLGLEVRRHERIGEHAARVEFVARSRVGGGPVDRLHEISRFVREAGRWYYVDGERVARPRPGRGR